MLDNPRKSCNFADYKQLIQLRILVMGNMKVELFIAKRLGLTPMANPNDAGGNRQKRSPAVAIAIGGVALAVAVMLITLAVVNGFQDAIRTKVMGFEPAIKLQPLGAVYENEADLIQLTSELQSAVAEAVPNAYVAEVIYQPVVLKTPDNFAGVNIAAFGVGHDFSFETSNIIEGAYPAENQEIMLSKTIVDKLGLKLGDKIDGAFFVDNSLRLRRFTISGIYSSNFADFDKLTAYTTFDAMQRLRHLEEGNADAVEITGLELNEVADASSRLQLSLREAFDHGRLTDGMFVTTVLESGAAYLGWLDLLDSNVIVILVIMTLVSGFTLISCMFILILQRVGMIGILKSMGGSNGMIRKVFLLLGGRIIFAGLLIGDMLGLGLLIVQQNFHVMKLDPSAYYLDAVPVEISLSNILIVNFGAILISLILMLIPASIIARISPSKTMRYE